MAVLGHHRYVTCFEGLGKSLCLACDKHESLTTNKHLLVLACGVFKTRQVRNYINLKPVFPEAEIFKHES